MALVNDPTRSRLGLDERRDQLLELGLQLFGTRAYDEVSIDDIAAEAGISKGLLYHYFGSKRAFYIATVRRASEGLLTALTSLAPELDGPTRLRSGLSRYLGWVEARAPAYTALVTGGLGADPEVAVVLEQTRSAIISQTLRDVGLTMPRPMFELAVRAAIGGVESAAIEWLGRRHIERSVLLEFLSQLMERTIEIAIGLDPEAGITLDPAGCDG